MTSKDSLPISQYVGRLPQESVAYCLVSYPLGYYRLHQDCHQMEVYEVAYIDMVEFLDLSLHRNISV